MLRCESYVPAGGFFHIARSRFAAARATQAPIHTHDFPEVFWIEEGAGMHFINGTTQPLKAGDLVLVRAQDAHGFAGAAGDMVLLNIAFRPEVLEDLRARYFPVSGWPWQGGDLPFCTRLGVAARRRFAERAAALAAAFTAPQSLLVVHRFLLNLLHDVAAPPAPQDSLVGLPPWMAEAIAELARRPALLEEGAGALPRLTGRSREHTARILRHCMGLSPSEFVNRLRLERAGEELRMGDKPIVRVALDAGYANLSYFYRRFVRHFGCTPLKYRVRHHGPMTGEV